MKIDLFNKAPKPKEKTQIEILETQLEAAKQAERVKNMPPPPAPPLSEKVNNGANGNIYANIPKKTCAQEVLKNLSLARYCGMGAILGVFLILLGGAFNPMYSYVLALVVIVPLGMYTYKVRNEINRLKIEYNI
jgi:hypothetical protein